MTQRKYCLHNGILHHNGQPVIGMGVSYYASYHPEKVPVPEDGPRYDEMRDDLRAIKESGFNTVRCAALGDVQRIDEGVRVDFPLIDAMLNEAERLDLACMVRLQGYDMILGDYSDGIMLNAEGKEMPFYWSWFIRNCINHPEVIADNEVGTAASAKHFAAYPAVVGYQIYNEPTYPGKSFYCYNPHTITAYRRWLRERYGSALQLDFDQIDPPRGRPGNEGDIQAWIDWRLFNTERMSEFICRMGEAAKDGDSDREVFTCLMPIPLSSQAAIRGQDYFTVALGTDLLGLTLYGVSDPKRTVRQRMVLDAVQAAATLADRAAWLIELDARTDLSGDDYERQTYAVLARGYKGILYYQWRADHPFPNSPEPQKFGIVQSDKRPTEKYDTVVQVNDLVNRLSPLLVQAEPVRSGVAILYSEHALAYYDGLGQIQSVLAVMKAWYQSFNKQQIVTDFVRADDLEANVLEVHLLFVASVKGLSGNDLKSLARYVARGGNVAVPSDECQPLIDMLSVDAHARVHRISTKSNEQEITLLLDTAGITQIIELTLQPEHDVEARCLVGDGYEMILLANFSSDAIPPMTLKLSRSVRPTSIEFHDTQRIIPLSYIVERDTVHILLPEVHTGGIIVVHCG